MCTPNQYHHVPLGFGRWIVAGIALSLGTALAQVDQAKADSPSAPAPEINLAQAALGTTVSGNGATGLSELISEKAAGTAALAPSSASGEAVATVNLPASAKVNRVALKVGKQKGRLLMYVIVADGTPAKPGEEKQARTLLQEFVLDGSQSSVTAEVAKSVAATAVTFVWVPEVAGQALTVNSVGIFSQVTPPAAATAASPTKAAPAAPTVAASTETAPAAAPTTPTSTATTTTAPAPAATTTTLATAPTATTTTTTTTTTSVAPTTATSVPPQTRPLSVP